MTPNKIYLFIGNNEFQIADLEKKAMDDKDVDPAMIDLNLFAADLPQTSKSEVLNNMQAMPFLTPFRYVVLRRIYSGGAEGIRLNDEPGQTEFMEMLKNVSPTTKVILSDSETDLNDFKCPASRKNFIQLMKTAFEKDLVFREAHLPAKREQQLPWVEAEAKKHGVSISRRAADELLERVELFDPRVISGELGKLSAYIGFEGEIGVEDVQAVGIRVFSADIFALTDHIGAGNKQKAIEAYHKIILDRSPEEVFQMIIRQFRIMLAIKDAERNGIALNSLANLQDLRSDFVRGKAAAQARKFTFEELQHILFKLLKIDEAVKTSKTDMVTATDLLIAEVS